MNNSTFTVTPSGGSAIAGAGSLASDLVTYTFVPAQPLQPGTVYTLQISGYSDVVGNSGTPFSSTFTTAASSAPINVSTGLGSAGNLITDQQHCRRATGSPTQPESHPRLRRAPSDRLRWERRSRCSPSGRGMPAGMADGQPTDRIRTGSPSIRTATTGNTFGLYYTTINIAGSVPANLCLVGAMGVDDNGLLALNGAAIMANISAIYSLTPLNIPVSSYLVTGQNVLSLGWGGNDNNYEGLPSAGQSSRPAAPASPAGLHLITPQSRLTAHPTSPPTPPSPSPSTIPLVPSSVNANTLPVMVGWNSNQEIEGNLRQVNGNQVIFTPDTPFPPNAQIWVGACGGPNDLAGDSAGGCYTQLTYFTTGGTATPAGTPFQIDCLLTPSNGATNVGLRNPRVTADLQPLHQPRAPSTPPATTPPCSRATDRAPGAPASPGRRTTPQSSSVAMRIAQQHRHDRDLWLNSHLTDWQGEHARPTSPASSRRRYYDSNTNGTVVGTRPGNGVSGIDVNEPITIYSNLPINPGTANGGIEVAQNNVAVPGTVQVLDNGYTLEFTPSSPWTPGALIQWWTNGTLLDATYQTPFNALSGYFTVAGSTATLTPTIQVTSPVNGTNPAALNTVFDTQFNTPINPSTITPANFYLYDNNTGLKTPVTYSQPQPNVIRMVPTSNLPANDTYSVFVQTGLQSTTSVPGHI